MRLRQNQPFAEAPWASASLVFEVNPMRTGTRMPKGLPEHREIIAIRAKPNDMLDTDPIGIAASKPVRDAQRAAIALAPSTQKALIPSARCQLIPDEGGYAARAADGQPRWSLATRGALPPISGHGCRCLTFKLTGGPRRRARAASRVPARPVQRRVRRQGQRRLLHAT